MSTMNISLPDTLKTFVDEQVSQRGYGTSSEYVRELIRKDQERQQLRSLLVAGAGSAPTPRPTKNTLPPCEPACRTRADEGQARHPESACAPGCR